jgi:4-amino-4-deoxy-L-arabinose transferase-like glycosyltransferase
MIDQSYKPARPPENTRLPGWLLPAITAFLLLNAASQWLVSGTADQDQAEQLLLAQNWALGYGAQPPLYTYLVKLLLPFTGVALWPLPLLKVVLLGLLVLALVRTGEALALRRDQQLLALTGLALIPQFMWEAQRDLTHSVLATTVAAFTLLQVLHLARRPEPARFIVLGVLVAAGVLSKYSFVVFATSLLLTSLTIPDLRRTLLRPALALSLITALLLLAPHLAWMLSHSDQAIRGLEKTRSLGPLNPAGAIAGITSAAKAAIAFLTPFWLVALAVLWPDRRRLHRADPGREPGQALLQRLPLVLTAAILVFVLATGATRIKDRWFQCLLFYAPLSVATLAPPLSGRRLRAMLGAGVTAATAAALLLPGRTLLAGVTGKSSRPNYPLPQLVASLGSRYGRPDRILASSGTIGGSARLVFPSVPVDTPRSLERGNVQAATAGETVLVLLDRDDDPAELTALAGQVLGRDFDPDQLPARLVEFSLPELHAPERSYPIRYVWIGAAGHS